MKRHGHTVPTPDVSHAAFLACRAAMAARKQGASEAEQRAAHDEAYRAALREAVAA